jgi:hypothetical protein
VSESATSEYACPCGERFEIDEPMAAGTHCPTCLRTVPPGGWGESMDDVLQRAADSVARLG